MAGRRSQFIRTFSRMGRALPFSLLRQMAGQRVLVLLYHAVSDDDPVHIRHLYKVKSRAGFEDDLDYLLRYLQPINVGQLRDHLHGITPLKKPSFLVTFDDGLREFHDVAVPVLEAKGVPAVCFLNSAFVDNHDLFFRYKASVLVDGLATTPEDLALKKRLLGLGYGGNDVLDKLARERKVDLRAFQSEAEPYMSSGQILALKARGFDFGAHSVDHPEYQYLDLEEQLWQTRHSLDFVTGELGIPDRYFAFPFTDHGVSRRFFTELYADDRPPDLSFGCAGLKRDVHPLHVQRIPLEMDGLSARDILPAEFLYYLAKAPLGKNKIRRP